MAQNWHLALSRAARFFSLTDDNRKPNFSLSSIYTFYGDLRNITQKSALVQFRQYRTFTVGREQCNHFDAEKPLFVTVQPISPQVHKDFVIVQYSANVSLIGGVQTI